MSALISGPTLCGFGDVFEESVLGAIPRSPGKQPPKTGKAGKKPGSSGPSKHPPVPRSKTVQQHGKVLASARMTAAKAVKAAHGAMAAAQKKAAPPPVHLGAAVEKALTPKQKLAVSQHKAAAAKTATAARNAAATARKARTAAIELAKKVKSQKSVSVALRKPKSATRIKGLVDYYTAIGAMPDPNNPGFLDDGSPDPAYQTMDAGTASDLDMGAESPMDAPELPAPPPMDQFIPDMNTVGGIPYDGSKGTPDGYCGSYGLFTRATDRKIVFSSPGIDGIEHSGYVFGQYNDEKQQGGLPWGDDLERGQWNHVHGRHVLLKKIEHEAVPFTEALKSPSRYNEAGVAYGPLIGNPATEFKGMRVDAAGNMFWLPQEAPDWLTFPLRQAAALTAQAEKKAAEEAAKADAARIAKEQADAAEAKAQQDAANALAESQAASEAKIAETKAQTEQQQQQTQAQQQLLEQAKVDQQQRQMEMEQNRQAGQLLLEQARMRQTYLQQHPEMMFAEEGGEEGAEGEEYGDEYAEDGGDASEDYGEE